MTNQCMVAWTEIGEHLSPSPLSAPPLTGASISLLGGRGVTVAAAGALSACCMVPWVKGMVVENLSPLSRRGHMIHPPNPPHTLLFAVKESGWKAPMSPTTRPEMARTAKSASSRLRLCDAIDVWSE